MGTHQFVKVAYKGVFNSVKAARRMGNSMAVLAEPIYGHLAVGAHVEIKDGPGNGGTLHFGLVFQSPADSKALDLVKSAFEKNHDVPYSLSGLIYHTISVEDLTVQETADFNKVLDEKDEREKRNAVRTDLSELPSGLAAFVAAMQAGGAEVTVIQL